MEKHINLSNENDQEIILDKQGMTVDIVGKFHLKKTQKKTITLRVIHRARSTTARILIRGVVEEQASLSILGTVVVEKSAQKTQSFLKEQILLLSKSAKAEAVPNLEIFANDVQCSHASSISHIDEHQMMYLMSRGLDESQARTQILNGFLK